MSFYMANKKFKDGNTLDSSSVLYNDEALNESLDNLITISEKGGVYLNSSNFTSYTFGNTTQYYCPIQFKKTYKNIPSVFVFVDDTSSRTYWGNFNSSVFIKDLKVTGFNLVDSGNTKYLSENNTQILVRWIVISND